MSVADAYSAGGEAWAAGPSRIYDRLAEVLVARLPGGVAGRAVLDLGAGTGAATRAALAAGARRVVATDVALGMLVVGRRGGDGGPGGAAGRTSTGIGSRPSAVVGDAAALPLRAGTVDAVVAAFSLNHLVDPVSGLAEAARVLAPGGGLVASAYAEDDTHPVKGAVEAALAARGWRPAAWYAEVKADAMPRLATVDRAAAAARAAGLHGARATHLRRPFPDLGPAELVAWRLGMAQSAGFVDALEPPERAAVAAEAQAALGSDPPPLVRSFVVVTWTKMTA